MALAADWRGKKGRSLGIYLSLPFYCPKYPLRPQLHFLYSSGAVWQTHLVLVSSRWPLHLGPGTTANCLRPLAQESKGFLLAIANVATQTPVWLLRSSIAVSQFPPPFLRCHAFCVPIRLWLPQLVTEGRFEKGWEDWYVLLRPFQCPLPPLLTHFPMPSGLMDPSSSVLSKFSSQKRP